MPSIQFYSEEIPFVLKKKLALKKWIQNCIQNEQKKLGEIVYIFCSDSHLYKMNVQYLNHDTYTDIITFDYSENEHVSGDLFISIDRVKENAEKLNIAFELELNRVMIHGVLHLCGYQDKSKSDSQVMRNKEDYYLAHFNS